MVIFFFKSNFYFLDAWAVEINSNWASIQKLEKKKKSFHFHWISVESCSLRAENVHKSLGLLESRWQQRNSCLHRGILNIRQIFVKSGRIFFVRSSFSNQFVSRDEDPVKFKRLTFPELLRWVRIDREHHRFLVTRVDIAIDDSRTLERFETISSRILIRGHGPKTSRPPRKWIRRGDNCHPTSNLSRLIVRKFWHGIVHYRTHECEASPILANRSAARIVLLFIFVVTKCE